MSERKDLDICPHCGKDFESLYQNELAQLRADNERLRKELADCGDELKEASRYTGGYVDPEEPPHA